MRTRDVCLGVKAAGLTTFMCLLSRYLSAITSCNAQSLSIPAHTLLYLSYTDLFCSYSELRRQHNEENDLPGRWCTWLWRDFHIWWHKQSSVGQFQRDRLLSIQNIVQCRLSLDWNSVRHRGTRQKSTRQWDQRPPSKVHSDPTEHSHSTTLP